MLLDTRAKVDAFTKSSNLQLPANYPQIQSYARISLTFDQYTSLAIPNNESNIVEIPEALLIKINR